MASLLIFYYPLGKRIPHDMVTYGEEKTYKKQNVVPMPNQIDVVRFDSAANINLSSIFD